MHDQPFSTNVLTLEILDAICERLENRPSALIFLDHEFSNNEITVLEDFLTQRTLSHIKTPVADLANQLHAVKPTFTPETTRMLARELSTAFLQEDRDAQALT
ncbi:hypothetical protein [Levilactobacillus sp. N40-8-2]|uniref:hypothetical protein n=1 Tax=Levilactobacillus muriae TaxID=3238987 RepID=UPI0038B24089